MCCYHCFLCCTTTVVSCLRVQVGVGAQVLSKLEALIDPFDFNVFHPYLLYYLEKQKQRANVRGREQYYILYMCLPVCLSAHVLPAVCTVYHKWVFVINELYKLSYMVVQILWGAVSGSAFLTSLATTKAKLAGVPQDRHQVLPLGPPVGRFTLLPIGGGTGNRRLEQPDEKPQVSLVLLVHRMRVW